MKKISAHHPNNVAPDEGDECMALCVPRYKPEEIEKISSKTKFSKSELQVMYRGFKQECPAGIVNREKFKSIFAKFFPLGDSAQYAQFVFNTFDSGNTGDISFENFVKGLSILCRGSFLDKIHWTFSLYDLNQDGVISRDEMTQIISAIYDMMGCCCVPPVEGTTPVQRVNLVFDKLDLNRDGFISLDEFVVCCQQDESIAKSMAVFDTML
jgi:Ca2+-binding EF-hand superfamily protein